MEIHMETETTFRGHVMMTFMAAVILKLMSDRLKKTSLLTASMFMNLHEQHVIIYDNEFITMEPVKKRMRLIRLSKCNALLLYRERSNNVEPQILGN